MRRPCFVSRGIGSFFGQIDWHGISDRLSHAIAVKLPNVLIPAPCNANLKIAVGIHRITMRSRYRKLQPCFSKKQVNSNSAFCLPLPKKLDGDLGRNPLDSFLNFLGGIRQPIRVDIDSCAAPGTDHVIVRLQAPDRLPEVVPAFRTLKSDLMEINASYRKMLPLERGRLEGSCHQIGTYDLRLIIVRSSIEYESILSEVPKYI